MLFNLFACILYFTPLIISKTYIIQFVINGNENLIDYNNLFFENEKSFILTTFEIGNINGCIVDYHIFPFHLYNYPIVDIIEEDHLVTIEYNRHHPYTRQFVIENENGHDQDKYREFATSYYLQQNPVWNLDRIDQRVSILNSKYYYNTFSGKHVNVFVVDTGIDIKHPEFGNRGLWGINTADTVNTDCNGHGTHVAGTIGSVMYGAAKKTNLISVKVLDCNGSGSYSNIIAGIEYIIKYHKNAKSASVVNMSLGGPKSDIINNIVNQMFSLGIHVIVAAGNENQDACNTSPASADNAISVGATSKSNELANFSNWGSCVHILAPGVDITSTYLGNTTAVLSGTSMASPLVAGIAALYLSMFPNTLPLTLKQLLVSKSTKNVISKIKSTTPNSLVYSIL